MQTETATKHTAELWEAPGTDGDAFVICAKDRNGKRRTKAHAYTREDAARIVRDHNACAGMEDPAKTLAEVRAFLRQNLGHYQVQADALLAALGA